MVEDQEGGHQSKGKFWGSDKVAWGKSLWECTWSVDLLHHTNCESYAGCTQTRYDLVIQWNICSKTVSSDRCNKTSSVCWKTVLPPSAPSSSTLSPQLGHDEVDYDEERRRHRTRDPSFAGCGGCNICWPSVSLEYVNQRQGGQQGPMRSLLGRNGTGSIDLQIMCSISFSRFYPQTMTVEFELLPDTHLDSKRTRTRAIWKSAMAHACAALA